MGKKLIALLERSAVGRKAVQSDRFRIMLTACWSLVVNLAYAVFSGIWGIVDSSWWFVTLFAYYAALAVMRFRIVTYEFRDNGNRSEYSVMVFCGGWLCFLAVVLSGMVCLTIAAEQDSSRHMILMIAMAAYTFWKATMAVINIVKARKRRQPLIIALRNINCANAVMSMLALEHAMLSTFGNAADPLTRHMDIGVGAASFLIVLALGVGMIAEGRHGNRAAAQGRSRAADKE